MRMCKTLLFFAELGFLFLTDAVWPCTLHKPLSPRRNILSDSFRAQPCPNNFLVHSALMGLATEEGELAEHQHQEVPRVCDRRAKRMVDTHQVSTIKHGNRSAGFVSCSGCISTICHIVQTNLGPCLLRASCCGVHQPSQLGTHGQR